ncbi:MAG: NUDIX domain-containing protein, partial [Candidatus Andersenbacteria bacterium]
AFILWKGKALIVKRSKDDNFLPEYWEQVGGKVDAGESQIEGLIREVQEEAGITIKPLQSYNQFEYTHRDGRLMCEYTYICELINEPIIVLSSEHQDYKWVDLQELEYISPMTDEMRSIIEKGFLETKTEPV